MINSRSRLLTTKQLPQLTGLSASYFEKGRSYGYGPPFIKIKSGKNRGRVFYRRAALEDWLRSQEHCPEGGHNAC